MYNNNYFKAESKDDVLSFMKSHPFAIIVGNSASGFPVATHIPILVQETGNEIVLVGHVSRNSTHFTAFMHDPKVMVIFQSNHAYVSASYYKDKQVASTWNYCAVHAEGMLDFTNETGLRKILKETTDSFEVQSSPSSYQHLPENYINKKIGLIAGFTINVTAINHVFKLSQNKDQEDYDSVITHLINGNEADQEMARKMYQYKK